MASGVPFEPTLPLAPRHFLLISTLIPLILPGAPPGTRLRNPQVSTRGPGSKGCVGCEGGGGGEGGRGRSHRDRMKNDARPLGLERRKRAMRKADLLTGLAIQTLGLEHDEDIRQAQMDRKLLQHLSGLPVYDGGWDSEDSQAERRERQKQREREKQREHERKRDKNRLQISVNPHRKRKRIKRRESRRYQEAKRKKREKRAAKMKKKKLNPVETESTTATGHDILENRFSSTGDPDTPSPENWMDGDKERDGMPLDRAKSASRLGVLSKAENRNERDLERVDYIDQSGQHQKEVVEPRIGAEDSSEDHERGRHGSSDSDWGLLGAKGRGKGAEPFDGVLIMEVDDNDRRVRKYRTRYSTRMWTGKGRERGRGKDYAMKQIDEEMERMRPITKPPTPAGTLIDELMSTFNDTTAQERMRAVELFQIAKDYEASQNYQAAFQEALKAAEAGLGEAQCYIGTFYANGIQVPQNYTIAVSWFHQAAASDIADAQYYLGLCYANGAGVTKNETAGFEYWMTAGLKGSVAAQNCLGGCYEKGIGTSKDLKEAMRWYRSAASQGHAQAGERVMEIRRILGEQDEKDDPDADEDEDEGWHLPPKYKIFPSFTVSMSYINVCRSKYAR
ncbi:hypothetical protein AAMO2058_000190100 [Amorphochlora amoebiformis]